MFNLFFLPLLASTFNCYQDLKLLINQSMLVNFGTVSEVVLITDLICDNFKIIESLSLSKVNVYKRRLAVNEY